MAHIILHSPGFAGLVAEKGEEPLGYTYGFICGDGVRLDWHFAEDGS